MPTLLVREWDACARTKVLVPIISLLTIKWFYLEDIFNPFFFEIENLNVMHGNVLSFLKYSSISSVLSLIISNKLIFHFWIDIVMIIFLITLVRGWYCHPLWRGQPLFCRTLYYSLLRIILWLLFITCFAVASILAAMKRQDNLCQVC